MADVKRLKITIIGAGSTYTPELIEGLIERAESFPLRDLVLMDIDERKLSIVGNLCKRMVEHKELGFPVSFTDSLDDALSGADFVFAQIRVGKLPARVLDEKIPLKHGLIGQETTGIGGFFKALRTVPVILDIGSRMEKLCPNATLINFSNPSGICAQAINDYGKTKALGLCNIPIGMMSDPLEALSLPVGETEVEYIGLNHLSFVTSIVHGGRDYLKEAVEGNGELLSKLDGQQGFDKETIRLVGAIPCGYLNYFFNPRKTLKKLNESEKSRGEQCMDIEEELLAMYSDANLYVKPPQLSQRGGSRYSEVAVSLAESIYLDKKDAHVVNLKNDGAIPFMEKDDVVETKAIIGADGAVPVPTKKTENLYVRTLIKSLKGYERYTVLAAVHGSRDDAIRALALNPLIFDHSAAKDCFDEMLEAHRDYLPRFFS